MIKFAAAVASLLLAACGAEDEESVEERFKRTEAAIEKTAADLEAKSENMVRTAENVLEDRADAFENSVEAAEPADGNEMAANQAL